MGRIEWIDGKPFAHGGDSGSLVWTTVKGKKVPIGLNKGSGDGESFCLLLQPVFDIIEEIFDEDFVFLFGVFIFLIFGGNTWSE
jgi:hypothetical protein